MYSVKNHQGSMKFYESSTDPVEIIHISWALHLPQITDNYPA